MTASELVTSLRAEVQNLVNNAEVNSVNGITLCYANGVERTIKLNLDKTWRLKPSESNGFVRIEWNDPSKNQPLIENGVYYIVEQVERLLLDPTQIVDFRFNYVVKRETNVNVETDGE
jgi:hypothetical protein